MSLNQPMQVVILAAGLGRRLAPLTLTTPKCLVEVQGETILEHNLHLLSSVPDIERFVIVLGHLGDIVRRKIGESWEGIPVRYVENEKYAETNNIYSLWMCRELLDRDTILMECDIYFEQAVLDRLVSNRQKNTVLVSPFRPYMDGTVVRMNDAGEILAMIGGKDQGETFDYSQVYKTVNMYFFRKDFLEKFFVPHLDLYIRTQPVDQYYELLLAVLIFLGNPKLFGTVLTEELWMEIDDFADLERAEILFSKPRDLYETIERSHGAYWKYDIKDFSYLYNPSFPPPEFLEELQRNLPVLVTNYSSGQRNVAEDLAHWVGIDASHLVVGNGASELIALLKRTIVRRIALPLPTFNEYERELAPDRIAYVPFRPGTYDIDPETFISIVKTSECNTALIINPNNPTGTHFPIEVLNRICRELSSIDAVIVDESFIDFADPRETQSLLPQLSRYPNLIVIRSLSKDLGIAGLRIGYLASGNANIVERLRKELPIWNINSIAEYALSILPKYRTAYQASCLALRAERERFTEELAKIHQFNIVPSAANFVFLSLPEGMRSDALARELFSRERILIKDCSGKTGLTEGACVRIAVKSREENDEFLLAFRRVITSLDSTSPSIVSPDRRVTT